MFPSGVWSRREFLKIVRDSSPGGSDDDTCDGELNTATGVISIRDDAPPPQFLLILGHELVHHWLAWSGLSQLLKHNVEEAICDAIGSSLIEFISANPDVVKYCQEVANGQGNDKSEG
jgi:hypothetical protein